MSKPLLLVDAYQDATGGARNFLEHLTSVPTLVVRPAYRPIDIDPSEISGLLISGSAASAAVDPPPWMNDFLRSLDTLLDAGIPTLGVCFGHQAIAHVLGGPGSVRLSPTPEIGWYDITISASDPLLHEFASPFRTFLSHVDEVMPVDGFETLAHTERCAVQAYRVTGRPIWGVQFHSEMKLAECTRLIESRAKKSPELEVVPEKVLEGRVDSSPIVAALLNNFLRVSGLHPGPESD